MSLRWRVITLVGLVLLISASIYAGMAWTSARRDLAAELSSAREGGERTVRSAFEDLPRSDHPARDLRQLVETFDGNRHLQVVLTDRAGRIQLQSQAERPRKKAPQWFAASLAPGLGPVQIPVPVGDGDVIRLTPDPSSDIAASWSAAASAVGVFAIAAALGLAFVYWVIGHALAPLADLSRGLRGIGSGGYRERVREAGPPELLTLQRGFNAMAERLTEIDARNRTLEAQLLTIQDEERAELASDLHDEIGPHLFAVALDAELIGRSVSNAETRLIPDHVRSIQSAVSYMQRQVREIIARLRPTRAAELGLEAAIGDLIDFWRARQPEIEFVHRVEGADGYVPEPLRDVIYRVAQESLANALKHADTDRISIAVARVPNGIAVEVANRGPAKAAGARSAGLGLTSMDERVQAAGGQLRIDRSGGGWTVIAQFARSDQAAVTA